MMVLINLRHYANIRRLLKGEEPAIGKSPGGISRLRRQRDTPPCLTLVPCLDINLPQNLAVLKVNDHIFDDPAS